MNKDKYSFQDLTEIIKKLRDPETGCPWDKEQTHSSLKPYAVEEVYEVLDAIDYNPSKLCEELGDLLLQIMLHSQVASDEKNFTITEVVDGLTKKLIVRHPHVFGETKVANSSEVLKNWEAIKKTEKKEKKGLLSGVPKSMPALLKAQRIGERVGRVGFDWDSATDIKAKVKEELNEFLEAKSPEHLEEEAGDLLFTLVQLFRKQGLDTEAVLQKANEKFSARFAKLENSFAGDLSGRSKEELNQAWEKIKKT